MRRIQRKIENTINESEFNFDLTTASINDKGNICLRNFGTFNDSEDEIIILSKSENEAIIRLFKKLRLENYELPF